MGFQNFFNTVIVHIHLTGSGAQSFRYPDCGTVGAMDHEGGIFACLSILRAKKRNNTDGAYGPYIVDGQIEWDRAKQVVEADSLSNIAAIGLQQQMNMFNVVLGGDGNGIMKPQHGPLIDEAGKEGVQLGWNGLGGAGLLNH